MLLCRYATYVTSAILPIRNVNLTSLPIARIVLILKAGCFLRTTPHSALGPGLPEPMSDQVPSHEHRHSLPIGYRVVKRSVLGGLHHEYGLMKEAA